MKWSFQPAPAFAAITRFSVSLLAFLVPLLFLTWTTEALETNKQALLVIVALVAFVCWFGGMVHAKTLTWRMGKSAAIPVVLLVVTVLSALFSRVGYQSWVGSQLQEYTSVLTTFALVVFFFVAVHALHDEKLQKRVLWLSLLSAGISGLFTLLSGLGGIGLLSFTKIAGFNTIGSINTMVIYLLAMSVLGLGMWVSSHGGNGYFGVGPIGLIGRICTLFTTVVAFLLLLSVDFWLMWMLAILGLVLLFLFSVTTHGISGSGSRLGVLFLLFFVSVLFLFLPSPIHLRISPVVTPSYAGSMAIATQTVTSGVKSFLLGSGPGTFTYDYIQHRSAGVNQSSFWAATFDRAKSHALTVLATTGVLGLVAWIVWVLWVTIVGIGALTRAREAHERQALYGVVAAWVLLLAASILYHATLSLLFLQWLLGAFLISAALPAAREHRFENSPRMAMGVSFGFVAVAIASVASVFVIGGRYGAEMAFLKAIKLDRQGAEATEVVRELGRALSLNSGSDVYYRNVSQALLKRIREVIASAEGKELSPEQIKQVQTLSVAAMNAVNRAADLEPNIVFNWVVRGNVYRELVSLVNQADTVAVASFERAKELDPVSPQHDLNIGRTYLAMADRYRRVGASAKSEARQEAKDKENEQLGLAEEAMNKALALKPDYAMAHYFLAAVFERQGRLEDATARLAALRDLAPLDVGLGFQLSQLYIRQQQYDEAKVELERVIGLQPNYSNARWYLASIYELEGNTAAAIEQVQKVAEANPENEAVAQRLAQLQGGVAVPEAIPEPVEEAPAEPAQ